MLTNPKHCIPIADTCFRIESHRQDDHLFDSRQNKKRRYRSESREKRFLRRHAELRRPTAPTWPPIFEQHGCEYIFDGRSGMFFEPQSNFFYYPKTKLYYGNDVQKYFRFDWGITPSFVSLPEHNDFGDGPLSLSCGYQARAQHTEILF